MIDLLSRFMTIWSHDSALATSSIKANKDFNRELKKAQDLGDRLYEEKLTFSTKSLEAFKILVDELPSEIQSEAKLYPKQYKLQGSGGAGNVATIPWICVFDRTITTSATQGYYLVYLFTSDCKGVYLSLNQGWTQYEKRFGTKQGRLEIMRKATVARNLLATTSNLDTTAIDLKSEASLAKGYEAGNIVSKYYSIENLPTKDEFIADLQDFITVYKELKAKVGLNILDIESSLPEDDFQEYVNESNAENLPDGPMEKPSLQETSGGTAYKRNPGRSKHAIVKAGYRCEVSHLHSTFISKSNGKPFVEAHHLVPMEFQSDFNVSIDVPENIVALCPNCHRAIHLAEDETKSTLIESLFNKRVDSLASRGIELDKNKLFNYYKNSL